MRSWEILSVYLKEMGISSIKKKHIGTGLVIV